MSEPKAQPDKSAATGASPGASPVERDKALVVPVAAASAVAIVVGVILRSAAAKIEPQVADLTAKIQRERVKDVMQKLSAEKQALDEVMSLEFAIGTGLILVGVSAIGAAALVHFRGTKPHRAAALLFPACFVAALYAAFMYGIESLAVTGFGSIALLAYVTSGPNARARKELEAVRTLPTRVEVAQVDEPHPYRSDYIAAQKAGAPKLLRPVSHLPPELAALLPAVGEGRPVGYYQLKKNIAYLAVVEADAYNVSDFTTILMSLEDVAPRFVVRPLPIVEGKRVRNTGVKFKDDPDFTDEYLVEASPSAGAKADPNAIREFLTSDARDALYELPKVWLVVEKSAMALSVYGAFDADAADKMLEVADVLFAEYGAEGGPSLLEPDGAVDTSGKPLAKKKKKKKAASHEAPPPAT